MTESDFPCSRALNKALAEQRSAQASQCDKAGYHHCENKFLDLI